MGKQQKLKEQRKLEGQEKDLKRGQKKIKFLKLVGVAVIILAALGAGVFSWKSFSTTNNQPPEIISKEKIAVLETNFGIIKFKMFQDDAPNTVANFERLASESFYDSIKFHRVIKDFMIQGGDPNSKDDDWSDDGMGGPGYQFEDEINDHKIVRGVVAMANSGPNTNGSQFFIVIAESAPWLDGQHTAFGEVIEGMDVVDAIEAVETNENDHPLEDVVINKVYVLEQ